MIGEQPGQPQAGDQPAAATANWAAVDWADLVPRLLLLASARLARLTWRGLRHGQVPGGQQPEDFVHDAIAKTLAGLRVWNHQACSLFQHLAGVVASDISHAAAAIENRITQGEDAAVLGEHADDAPDQEQAALWQAEHRRLLAHLTAIDPKLGAMAALMLDQDLRETAALTMALGVTAAEVANLRKRLKRAIRAFLEAATP